MKQLKSGYFLGSAVFSALIWQTHYIYEKFDKTRVCVRNGNGLAAVKMPGGSNPWEIDVDFGFSMDYYDDLEAYYRKYMKEEFGIAASKSVSKSKDVGFELHHLMGSHYWVDHYG